MVAVEDDGIELTAKWREEWVVNLERHFTHGGILAALVDLGADWAMVRKAGRGVPTIDMRVDYHAVAHARRSHHQGQDRAHGRPVLDRGGAIFDAQGKLLASGPRHLSHRAAPAPKGWTSSTGRLR